MSLQTKSFLGVAGTLLCLFAMLFWPAGTLDYWQGWLSFLGSSAVAIGITAYLSRSAPDLLARRMEGGPWAERERSQQVIQVVNAVAICLMAVLGGLDRRYGWSAVPAWLTIAGFLVALGSTVGITLVGRQNHYMAATVRVEAEQKVVTTGFYARVRHPMYAFFTLFLLGAPLSLGSWRVFVPAGVVLAMLVVRLFYEEWYLLDNLPGYREYCQEVRWRLIPGVF